MHIEDMCSVKHRIGMIFISQQLVKVISVDSMITWIKYIDP